MVMRRRRGMLTVITALFIGFLSMGVTVNAEEKIETGIYADEVNISGMTVSEARNAVQEYVDSFGDVQITLHADRKSVV